MTVCKYRLLSDVIGGTTASDRKGQVTDVELEK